MANMIDITEKEKDQHTWKCEYWAGPLYQYRCTDCDTTMVSFPDGTYPSIMKRDLDKFKNCKGIQNNG